MEFFSGTSLDMGDTFDLTAGWMPVDQSDQYDVQIQPKSAATIMQTATK